MEGDSNEHDYIDIGSHLGVREKPSAREIPRSP